MEFTTALEFKISSQLNIEAETLDSLRKLVRELQKENTYLKEQLKKANIVFPENNVFEDKIEDTSEYDSDQGRG